MKAGAIHTIQHNLQCKAAQITKTFGAPTVNAEMGQPRQERGESEHEPATAALNAREPDQDIEMQVNRDFPCLEIEAEDNEEAPTPIAVWQELVEEDCPIGVNEDLMAKTRICQNSYDFCDESRWVPVDLEANNLGQDTRSIY